MTTSIQKQIVQAKSEAETSLASARNLRNQWLVAAKESPTNMTKKEVDQTTRALKNRILTLKWDCEDLEELVNMGSGDLNGTTIKLSDLREFIEECRNEIKTALGQVESFETTSRIYNKHGITLAQHSANPTITNGANGSSVGSESPTNNINTNTITSKTTNPISQQEPQVSEFDVGEIHFDKNQIEASTTIFENALYDHYDHEDRLLKNINATQVFNNLTRPTTDVYMNPNENEMILEMLETEYYNPPAGLLQKTRYDYLMSKFFDADRNKFLGTVALIFSMPILLIIFLAAF